MKLLRIESARPAGGENGFLKRPGMVDEFDQQVSTSMDGKPIFLQPYRPEISTQHQHTDRQRHHLTSACLQQACQETGHFLLESLYHVTCGKHGRALQPCLREHTLNYFHLALESVSLQQTYL